MHYSARLLALSSFAWLLALPSLRAQQTITYTDTQDRTAVIDTTAPNSPTTLTLSTGSATQSGAITGTGELNKSGNGTIILTGNNNYTGDTHILGGILSLGSANAVGSSGTIFFQGLAGTRLQFSSANTTDYSSRFSTAGTQTYGFDTNGQNVTLATALGWGNRLYKYGSGTLTLNGIDAGGGLGPTVSLNGGVLDLNLSTNQSLDAPISTVTGSTLRKSGSGVLTLLGNSITGNGNLDIAGGSINATASTLNLGGSLSTTALTGSGTLSGNSISIYGGISNFTGTINTSGSLTVMGDGNTFNGTINSSGTFTATGIMKLGSSSSVTASGGITVSQASYPYSGGTLIVNNTLSNTVSVTNGATLGGSGTLNALATFASGAHLAPGNSPGTLTFTNGLTLNGGSVLDFELGTSNDKIVVSGGTLSGPSSGTVTVNISDSGGFAANTFILFDFSGASLSNFTAGKFVVGNKVSGYDYAFNLTGSTLSLVASLTPIPEPSTYAMLAGLGALGLVIVCRRHPKV